MLPEIVYTIKDIMNTDVVTISPKESIVDAAEKMSRNRISCVIVIDDESIVGIITESDLINSIFTKSGDWSKTKVEEVMSYMLETASPDMSILDARKIMSDCNFRRLPVVENNSLVGLVTQTDITKALTTLGIGKVVKDIMSPDVFSVDSNENVAKAAEIMSEKGISCVIIVEMNMPVGIFTERDFMKKIVAGKLDPWKIKVADVMSQPLITVSADYSVFSASRIMNKSKIRKLIVMENFKLLGIVTQTDILDAIPDLVNHKVIKESLNLVN